MPANTINVDIGIIKDRIKQYEDNIKLLDSKIERNSASYIETLRRMESRINILESENAAKGGRIQELLEYKNSSNVRISSVEKWKWYTLGGLTVVAFSCSAIIALIWNGYLTPPR